MSAVAENYGVQHIVEALKNTLIAYLEMQYHIKDTSLIRERNRLLMQDNVIFRPPCVESTPLYELGQDYNQINIPAAVKKILTQLSKFNVGIYPKPYQHQVAALEAFLTEQADLIIATGTGSGKTESFLMPILGSLIQEADERPASAQMPGCRALLLYPLNALVNDQLARLRKLFGHEEIAILIAQGRERLIRFGAYNSRTPYPGPRTAAKDYQYIKPLFEDYYLIKNAEVEPTKLQENTELRQKLARLGRWPAKNLEGFYNADKVKQGVYASGKKQGQSYEIHNWSDRLKTQPHDRELLTRHEMQENCPDLLITNYSMLEYMLMRPLERSLFQQTKAWLAADKRNEFILVLDEAHLYRGTGGAEVALLIRRLQARLGISRDRMRCILTSASLGEEAEVKQFAQDLTGLTERSQHRFKLITGQREQRQGAQAGTLVEAQALADFELKAFNHYHVNKQAAIDSVMPLAKKLAWSTDKPDDLHQYLYDHLTGFGPAETLIQRTSGQAIEFEKLAQVLFPQVPLEIQKSATATLLSLGTFARRRSDERVFIPTRLHLFYRGLSGLYACINPQCDCRLDTAGKDYLLGKLYTTPKIHCDCGGRVYELLTHADCGSAFIRGYWQGERGDFLLHEPSGQVGEESIASLTEVHILVEKIYQPPDTAAAIYINITTGQLERTKPDKAGFLKVYIANQSSEPINGKPQITFDECPVCTRDLTRFRYKLTGFETKGEGTFANLVKAQVIHQPPQNQENRDSPNDGRKSLLFSDGRQKAARLALFIPREVELDSFRQALCLAAHQLVEQRREVKLTTDLYIAFISVVYRFNLHFFDGQSQVELQEHIQKFSDYYEANLQDALEDRWQIIPPARYNEALLRQLCHPYYSLQATTIGYIKPTKRTETRLKPEISKILANRLINDEEPDAIIIAWISDLLKDYAFNKDISVSQRKRAANYDRGSWGNTGRFRPSVKKILQEHYQLTEPLIKNLEENLLKALSTSENNLHFLDPNNISLVIDLTRNWYHCHNCAFISPVVIAHCCPQCGKKNVVLLSPEDEYIKTRKRFWREPVVEVLEGKKHPRHITAEEHTAQLSHRDIGELHATTEKHELQFQDILLDKDEGPIDVLSCTTTMEVGIDIGALTAVGLRNVPPQRQNYQQRAGRAGRRGSAVSTVITYAQGGPHDSYYFHHPARIIAGEPPKPVIDITNEKIARRHIHAFLFQTFFHTAIDEGKIKATPSSNLFSALGNTQDFFAHNQQGNLTKFKAWVQQNILDVNGELCQEILAWLPDIKLSADKIQWLQQKVTQELLEKLEPVVSKDHAEAELLDFLFSQNLLPRYAFPTDLCSFLIEKVDKHRIGIKEQPQQSITKALSEYAPGRLLIINKETYRCGGVTSALANPDELNKAEPLFKDQVLPRYAHCNRCNYVQDTFTNKNIAVLPQCPVCTGEMKSADLLIPDIFRPEGGRAVEEYDRDQELTYASSAQLPIPVDREELGQWKKMGAQGKFVHALDRRLVVVNKGKEVGTEEGFNICIKCGATVPINTNLTLNSKHQRPYLVKNGHHDRLCRGETRSVLLGTTFYSDLLLIRIPLRLPFNTDMRSSIARNALEDGLRSLAEALLLAASRTLDVDPAELNAGFRIVPNQEFTINADIYLFDTLAGGAGYAHQAGGQLECILKEMRDLLENCPNQCERSCQDCLRHYANQYWHEHLDRHLAADLLRYLWAETLPKDIEISEQKKKLYTLKKLLELNNYELFANSIWPLAVKYKNNQWIIKVYPGLKEEPAPEPNIFWLNGYLLDRNLPGAYQNFLAFLDG